MDIARVCPGCLRQTPARAAVAAHRRITASRPLLQPRRPRNVPVGRPREARRGYSTGHSPKAPPEKVAVLGGGITGLTTAYYLAKFLPATSTITLYEANDRIGGWIDTVKKTAPDGQPVYFENGPRMLRGLGGSGFRADDYVFYDMV